MDGFAVARTTIGLDTKADKFWGIPNRQKAGNLQRERRRPGKLAILAAASGPRNLTAPWPCPDLRVPVCAGILRLAAALPPLPHCDIPVVPCRSETLAEAMISDNRTIPRLARPRQPGEIKAHEYASSAAPSARKMFLNYLISTVYL